jgi:catalase
MSNEERARLVDTLVDHMGDIPKETQTRQIGHFAKADADLGARLAAGLGHAAPAPPPVPAKP